MNYIIVKIIVLILFSLGSIAQTTDSYKIDSKFNRMTLKKTELKKLLEAIKYYHDHENLDTLLKKRVPSTEISLTLKSRNSTKQINGFSKISTVDISGDRIAEVNLSYYSMFNTVSSIDIRLSSYGRELSVKGTDERRVKALSDELSAYLSSSERFLGFIAWDMIFSVLIFTSFIVGQLIFFNIRVIDKNPQSLADIKKIRWVLGGFLVLCVIYFVSNYSAQDIFPGFLLVEEDTSWYDKYGNLIGVASVFIPIIFAVFKYLRGVYQISFYSANRKQ